MTDTIPAAIQAFVDATNRGDVDGFIAVFTPDATLTDWGRAFHGPSGIASWNRTDNIGVQAHFRIVGVEATDREDTFVATLAVTGNGYNGTGPMTFTIDGDRIARLTIEPSS